MANELSSRIDRDKLFMMPRDQVAHIAHALLNGGKEQSGEMLAVSTAVLFAVISERTQMDPEELFRVGRKVLFDPQPHHTKGSVHLEALRDFAGLRIRNQPIV